MADVKLRKGDVVLYERKSSYTSLTTGHHSSADWRLGTIEAATRDGLWEKLRDAEWGTVFRRSYDRGRSVGSTLQLPANIIDVDALKAAPEWKQTFKTPDEARAALGKFKR